MESFLPHWAHSNLRAGYKDVGFVGKTLDGPVSKRLASSSPGKRGSSNREALDTSSEDWDGTGQHGDKRSPVMDMKHYTGTASADAFVQKLL